MIKILIACFFAFVTSFSYAQETVYSNDNKKAYPAVEVKPGEVQQGMQNSEVKAYLKDMLNKLETIGPFHFKQLTTNTINSYDDKTHELLDKLTDTVKHVVWVKGKFIRIEVESASNPTFLGSLMIVHPDWVYGYDKSLGWSRMPGEKETTYNSRLIKLLDNPTVRILGKETMDGKESTVIEYQVGDNIAKTTCKDWIWDEKGVTLKSELTTESIGTIRTINIDYTDYVFEDIPDSLFEVPKDKVIDNPLFQGKTN